MFSMARVKRVQRRLAAGIAAAFGPLTEPPKVPHFVADYNEMVQRMLKDMPHAEVMQRGIGGNYVQFGIIQRSILTTCGLEPNHRLIDIGCGSGRTAFALRDLPELQYLGTDVVELFPRTRAYGLQTSGLAIRFEYGSDNSGGG